MLKKFVYFLFNITGIYIVKRPKYKGRSEFFIEDLPYEPILPFSNYAPWKGNKIFVELLKIIKGDFKYTLVDKYRAYELWQLVEYAIKLNPELAFLEVGVWRGGTAAIIGTQLMLQKSNSILFLADTFEGVANAGVNDDFYKGGEHNDTNEPMVRDLLDNKVGLKNYQIIKGIFPKDTKHLINDAVKFSFCHIDVDVYQSAKEVLEWVWPKLAIRGIVVFDDYGFHSCTGIAKLVESYRSLADRMIVHNLNGHAIMIKLS